MNSVCAPSTAKTAWAVLLILLVLSVASAHAQEARGMIRGRVTDANQSIVPGASVKIIDEARGTTVLLKTNDNGLFEGSYLLPSTYKIDVEAPGFKQYSRTGILVQVGGSVEIDVKLIVGEVTETVTVTADASPLETTTGSLGTVVNSRRVAELPTPHGDPFYLMGLAGGASFTGSQKLDRPFEPTHIVGYSIDGTRGNRSDITIDGVSSTARANGGEVIASYVPPSDLLQEFKVQTATFDASSGNTEGGVTNLSIKTGTNNLHGTAYFWAEPGQLAANDFFGNAAIPQKPRPDIYSYRWGGVAGGPVFLPKLYNGRNRTFFMYGFESIHEARPRNNGTPSIPTTAMKAGDFSALLALGPQYQIYNPFTRRPDPNRAGHFIEDPLKNNNFANLVDKNGRSLPMNPVALNLLKFFPDPTSAGKANGTGNFAQPDLKETAKYATNTIRIDHTINAKQKIFGRVSWYRRTSDYNNYFHNLATGEQFGFISRQGALDHVYVINSSTVLNLRYGYNRFIRSIDSNPANHGFDLTSVGFPAAYNSAIPANKRHFPRLDITGYQGTGQGAEFRPNDTHSFVATVNKTIGSHLLRTGIEFRSYRQTDSFAINDVTGRFAFDSSWTRGPADDAKVLQESAPALSFASFLMGLPSTTNSYVSRLADYAEQSTTWGLFVQDDWKFNQKLTLNLGLRYEIEGALTERYNKSVRGFDYSYVQPVEAAVRANYVPNSSPLVPAIPVSDFRVRGGLTFAGVGGQPRGLYETPKKNFMPRFNFAYKLTDRIVVRGGYGIFFGFLGQRRGDVIQSGFSQTTNFVPTTNNGLDFIATLSNPFPNGIQEPVGAAQGAQTFLGQGIAFFNPRPFSPYMQRCN